MYGNNSISIYIALWIMNNLEKIQVYRRITRLYTNDMAFYMRLKNIQILESVGVLEPIPHEKQRLAIP
jgi:hypothetical protein